MSCLIRDNNVIIEKLQEMGVQFTPILKLQEEFKKSNLVFEGAQGSAIDLQIGTDYPFVTSSDCTVSGIYSSVFHFVKLDHVYGVGKPYFTKSGNGRLITEMPEKEAEIIRERGSEKGATTGRNRRIGYLDLPLAEYCIKKSGITDLIFSKLDIMNEMKEIKVCNIYDKPVYSAGDFKDVVPYYINLRGWNDGKNIEEISPFLNYVKRSLGTHIAYVSAGVNDEDVIKL